MLASTVQFSTTHQTPAPCPRQTRTTHRRHDGTRNRPALTETTPHPLPGRPVPSGPNSVPTNQPHAHAPVHTPEVRRPQMPYWEPATRAGRTGQRSTLEHHPGNRHPSTTERRPRPGMALDRQREAAGLVLLRKEVIQPHLPVRLPCYDFVPIADPA